MFDYLLIDYSDIFNSNPRIPGLENSLFCKPENRFFPSQSRRSGYKPGDRRHRHHLRFRLESAQRHPGVLARPPHRSGQQGHDIPVRDAQQRRGTRHAGGQEEDDAHASRGQTGNGRKRREFHQARVG